MSKKGKLVLYSGASGVGKGTLLEMLKQRDKNIRVSVSNTTREPRPGEVDGVHYHFVTKPQFKKLIEQNGFIEYAEYCDNYYGTPKKPVDDMLRQGLTVFLEIEVQGGLQVMARYPDVLSIFILPPSIDELESRLRNRGTESEEVILKRLEQAENELSLKDKYQYNIVNDDLERAVEEILNILEKEEN